MLSPSRMAQNISESPSAITVIDHQTIVAMGARKIVDVLRLVPGMITGSVYGNLPTIGYHGMSDGYARRIQVLVDGRSTWQPATGGVFWSNLPVPIPDIDRIEVIRAPNAASYGSSAFSATINIYTRHSSEQVGNTVRASVGENGIDDRYLHHGGQAGDLGYSISGILQQDRGYEALHDSREDAALFVRLDYAVTNRDEVTAEAGISEGDYGAGDNSILSPYRTIEQRNDFQYLTWIRALEGGDEMKFALSRNHFENLHAHPVGPLPFLPVGVLNFDYTYRVNRYDVEFQHTLLPTERIHVVWGLGGRRDEMESIAYFDTDENQVNEIWRGFAQTEYRITENTLLNGGFMVEDSQLIEPELSPRFAVIHHPAPGHSIRASASTGTRLATMWENQSRQNITNESGTFKVYKTISSGVDSIERARSYDLGYMYQPHRSLMLDARIYTDHLKDLVTQYLRPVEPGQIGYFETQVLDFQNADEVRIDGFETQIDWRIGMSDRVVGAYAFTEIEPQGDAAASYKNSAPKHQVSAMWSHAFGGGLHGSLIYTWQDEMAWIDEGMIEAYDRLDGRLAKTIRLAGTIVNLELVGQNLSGSYSDYRADARWERVYFVSARLDF